MGNVNKRFVKKKTNKTSLFSISSTTDDISPIKATKYSNYLTIEDCNIICAYWGRTVGLRLDYVPTDILSIINIYYSPQVEHTKTEREIYELLSTVSPHPFCVRTKYIFSTSKKIYFINEWYPGGELFFHLKKKRRFAEAEAKFMLAQIVLAVGHLHKLNIIHRCIKPEDIYFDRDGYCILGDYGLSKILPKDELANTFCGTPEYLAPEIVKNLGHSFPSDWWSIGILLYELTVGIPPFYSQNITEMYRKIQEAPLLFPPNLSNQCKSIITQLLQRDPSTRLGTPSPGNENEIGVENIKRHAFFASIEWDKLLKKELIPIFKPKLEFDENEKRFKLNNFDKLFVEEKVIDSPVATPKIKQELFDDFEWVNIEYKDL